MPALGHVGVCPQPGLQRVLAVEGVDGVRGVLRDAARLCGELGGQLDERETGVEGRVEEECAG